jgi:transcriptional regulator with GAF, ATPase, and Fis domain
VPSSSGKSTEGRAPSRPRNATIRRFRLSVAAGPDAGQSHTSSAPRIVVGTHPSADFVLRDRTVSRFHIEIVLGEDQVRLRDLGSRNGTIVNDVRVYDAELAKDSTLLIGGTELRFEASPGHAQIPLSERTEFGSMVGRSAPMRAAFAVLEAAAGSTATVLLEGETGTGKEVAAQSIHEESGRRDGPFVVVDCGAIPEALVESELFGHERGAFTGAVATRQGAFAEASGGTLFLDEIGELPLAVQPKLLRALEQKQVKPVGSNQYRPVDVRVIAATNRDLRAEVNARRFRADLYYRLAVLRLVLPPLRDCPEDLPTLVDHIIGQLGAQARGQAELLRGADFLDELARHLWPGNVRELRNYVERRLALPSDAPPPPSDRRDAKDLFDSTKPLRTARLEWANMLERRYLIEVLRRHNDNVSAAARAAGLGRVQFYRLLWRYGLR